MNQQKIKLGIIGAGKVTTLPGRHLDSIRALQDPDAEITAVADITPGLAKQVAKEFSIPYAFTDYHDLLAMEDINAVTINTPTFTHCDIAIECLKAGKHVYLEKPVTQDEVEMERLMEAVRESGQVFVGGSNGLLQSQMGIFKNMIDAGELGEVYMVSVDRASSRSSEYGMDIRPKNGSGISTHSGSHNVEWALYFLGDPKPVSVVAKGYYKYQSLTMRPELQPLDDDCCVATVFFDNGSTFLFKALRAAPAMDMYEMKIYGDKMSISYDVQKCYKQKSDDCIRYYEYDPISGMQEIRPRISCGKTHSDMYRHFFHCIRTGETSICSGERALTVMKILDAMTKSIEAGGKQIFLD